MPTAVALSPHLDDAAFSCGATLAGLVRRGWRTVVATVFTASVPDPRGFALACQLDKGVSAEVDYMALRRDEDLRATRALGAEARWLDLPEAPHRGYGSAPELFGNRRADDDIGPALAPALAALVAELAPDLVLAPQAIGGHVDHVQVVEALQGLSLPQPILWWRDFPYTLRSAVPREPLGGRFATMPELVVPAPAEDATAKRDACQCYRSQLGFQFGGAAGLDARLAEAGAVETFRRSGPVPWL